MAKKRLSSIYARASDRAYMYTKSREGKTDRGLGSAMRFRHYEGGNKKLAELKCQKIYLLSKDTVQVPQPCLQNIRIRLNKKLSKVAPGAYFLKFLKYPHQILRHHGMATGAKADRISQGMSNAFGKPLAKAIRITTEGRFLMVKYTNSRLTEAIKDVLKRIAICLPFRGKLVVEKSFTPKGARPLSSTSN